MTDTPTNPPRWAQALVRSLLKPSDAESIPGNLLEQYRAVRRPARGRMQADLWYVKHVMSVLWRVLWPCAVLMAVLKVPSLAVHRPWNPSLVPLPDVSLLDALTFAVAGYYGAQRTCLIWTGIVAAGATSLLGFAMTAVIMEIRVPGLLPGLIEQPGLLIIASIMLAVAIGFGLVVGTVGAALGRWSPPTMWRARFS